MRAFLQRMRIVLLAFFFMILATGFMIFPELMVDLANNIDGQSGGARVLTVLAGIVIDILLGIVIYREYQSFRQGMKNMIKRGDKEKSEATIQEPKSGGFFKKRDKEADVSESVEKKPASAVVSPPSDEEDEIDFSQFITDKPKESATDSD